MLYASVYDKDSTLVADLKKEDFTIFEDRIQQEVTYFGQDDVPSTLGVVIDSSGSMRDKFDLVNEATRLFLSKNNPENELFFVAFKDEVRLEQNFTRDVEDIYDALDNVIISGGTALYDAIYLAVDKALQGNEPKKTVIVFTDGEDKDSYYSHQELIEKVEESDVQLCIVAFSRLGSLEGRWLLRRLQIAKRENSTKDPGHSPKHRRRSFFSRRTQPAQ